MRRTMRWQIWMLMAGGLLAACASPGPDGGSAADPGVAVGPVELGVHGALPLIHTRNDPLLASRIGIGGTDAPWRYDASYAVEPGDVFSHVDAPPGRAPPQRFGGQRVGQDLRMQLPTPVGAPVALRFSAETREHWTTGGATVGQQRQGANLDWSPRLARLNLQWAGSAAAIDSQLALGCELLGTLRVPLQTTESATSQALRISGRDCRVLTSDPRYDALAAETWGVALAWNRPERETEILASVIDPVWKDVPDRQHIDAGYEFGVSHRRDRGLWSARTLVAMRYATAWDLSAPCDATGYYASDSDAYLTASASLTRQLPGVSLSANWAHSADPMWFMPEIGQRRHRLDMKLDLSRAVAALMPDATPQVAMHWNWSQARSRTDAVTGDNAVRLNMAVVW